MEGILRTVLGGVAGGAQANLTELQKEADLKRQKSFAALMQQYGRENMEFGNKLATDRDATNRKNAKEDDFESYIRKRSADASDYDKQTKDKRLDADTQYGREKGLLGMKMSHESALTDKEIQAKKELYKLEGLAKPEIKPGTALKEISTIDTQIGNIRKGNMLTEDGMSDILEKMPELAPFINTKAEMSPEDKEKVIRSLTKYRNYLSRFIPYENSGIISNEDEDSDVDDIELDINSLLGE
jgi:hypothetical protein